MSIKANMQRIFLSPHKRFKAALPKCTASAFLLMLCGRCSVLFFNNGHSLYSQIANISFSSISKRQRWNPPLPCGLQIAQRTYRKMINACTYYCFLILSHWWKLSLLVICSPYLSCFPLLLLHMKLFHTGNRQTSEWAWSSRRRRQWAPFIMLNYAPFRPLSSCDLEIYPLRHRGGDLIP